MIDKARELLEKDAAPQGSNFDMNCGGAGRQTVMHFPLPSDPRYRGDMEDPGGGVRHSVQGKDTVHIKRATEMNFVLSIHTEYLGSSRTIEIISVIGSDLFLMISFLQLGRLFFQGLSIRSRPGRIL